ncbi:MAG: isochorismate synthase [Myxococcota bacterium]
MSTLEPHAPRLRPRAPSPAAGEARPRVENPASPAGHLAVTSFDVPAGALEDPWRGLEGALQAPTWFAWSDERRGVAFVASGVAAQWSRAKAGPLGMPGGAGDPRFRWREQFAAHPNAPLVLAGRGFASGCAALSTSPWRGLPGVRFWVPNWIVFRRPETRGALAVARQGNRPQGPGAANFLAHARVHRAAATTSLRWRSVPSLETYQARVADAVGTLRENHPAGGLEKVVLCRTAVATSDEGPFDAAATLRALRRDHPDAIVFGVGFGDGRAFVGATPELLAHVTAGHLFTQAVAGTAPAGAPDAALLASDKDRHEHALVVDGIVATLAPLAARIDGADAPPRVARAGRIQHLVTPLEAPLKDGSGVLDVVDRLHPTPALCGTPRDAAAAYVRRHEGVDRGWYGAPVGWTSPDGDGTFAVAIRSALLDGRHAYAYAGAGVVAASDPRREREETEQKLTTLATALRSSKLRPSSGVTEPRGVS